MTRAQQPCRWLLAPLSGALVLWLLAAGVVVQAASLREYVARFNREDAELYTNAIPNAQALAFLEKNIPTFECPDADLERTYYFRWWTYRKHIKETPDGFVITEFLPQVSWSGKHNTINCPAGHHFREGRWLRDPKYLDDYAVFWFRKGGNLRAYSFWAADSIYQRSLVRGDFAQAVDLLPDLVANYHEWEKAKREPDGLFWQIDDRDGMEVSIGGAGYGGQGKRPTINSYLYGDARAIAAIARIAKNDAVAQEFTTKADAVQKLVDEKLWNAADQFYETLPRAAAAGQFVNVRELHGFTPWYFLLPPPGQGREVAWKQVRDPQGFYAPFGLTTAEQRHPKFAVAYSGHECQWNGPSWPFATAVTLTALANVLNEYPQDAVSGKDYLDLLRIYARSHTRTNAAGQVMCWIDENQNPFTGDWIARTMNQRTRAQQGVAGQQPEERGKDYNHSTFCDLVISGLMGLRPRADEVVQVNPLFREAGWEWCRLEKIPYHGRLLTIQWDRNGKKFKNGAGLRVFADGRLIAQSAKLERLEARLP